MNKLYEQVSEMVRLQNKMNKIVNPNWATARYPFLRAAMVEAVEAMEHYGYKWWKKQEPNIPQVQMEIVDIIHFLISDYIVEKTRSASWDVSDDSIIDDVIEQIVGDIETVTNFDPVIKQLEGIIKLSVSGINSFSEVIALLPMVGMNWDKLFSMYIGKNALNVFRQDHGYLDGSYIKIWNGREDNEHLYEILENIDLRFSNVFDTIYKALSKRYQSL